MNSILDPTFGAALRSELIAHATPKPRRRRRMVAAFGAVAAGALIFGGVTAVAGPKPAGEGVGQPLLPPIVVNGVGPAHVVLPQAPAAAKYVHLELTCYDGTNCATPGGAASRASDDGTPMVQRDAVPLTLQAQQDSAQILPILDQKTGLPIEVNAGTHWRLYAVFVDRLTPAPAPAGDGRTLGIPGNWAPPDLVPMIATNGRAGYVDYLLLTDQGHPTLTRQGTQQPPLPVYDVDGTTVIGVADVSRPYR